MTKNRHKTCRCTVSQARRRRRRTNQITVPFFGQKRIFFAFLIGFLMK
jgi:hypothetical protein